MTELKLDYIHFLDGPGVPRARETGVVNHVPVADIDAVMRVSVAWGDQMRADRRFNRASRRPACVCGRWEVLLRMTVRAHGTNVSWRHSPRHEAALTLPEANLMGEAPMPRGASDLTDQHSSPDPSPMGEQRELLLPNPSRQRTAYLNRRSSCRDQYRRHGVAPSAGDVNAGSGSAGAGAAGTGLPVSCDLLAFAAPLITDAGRTARSVTTGTPDSQTNRPPHTLRHRDRRRGQTLSRGSRVRQKVVVSLPQGILMACR